MSDSALKTSDLQDGWEEADFGLRVKSGDPNVRVLVVYDGEAQGKGPTVAFAKVSPSSFEVTLEAYESINVIEGSATIVIEGGDTLELVPGAAAYLEQGSVCNWTVHEPLLEFFSLSA